MNPSHAYDPDLHEAGSLAARGRCTYHAQDDAECNDEAVVSYEDRDGTWHAACARGLEQLVERGEIEPLGQGA